MLVIIDEPGRIIIVFSQLKPLYVAEAYNHQLIQRIMIISRLGGWESTSFLSEDH